MILYTNGEEIITINLTNCKYTVSDGCNYFAADLLDSESAFCFINELEARGWQLYETH